MANAKTPENPADLVLISHPKLKGGSTATTTRAAFDKVWKAKGWLIVTPEQAAEAAGTPAQTPDKES